MARDFRTKQIRTSLVIASGSLTGSNPNLGLVFLSGSKMLNFDGQMLTGSGNAAIGPAIPSTPLFDANNQPGFEPGLYLGHNSIGHDVWCLFDGASNGPTGTSTRRRDGSTVLFMGDVVVSGSLFAERHVVEVDSTVDGNFIAPKDSHLSGGLYSGEQATGIYALRVNPHDSIKDGIPANTVQINNSVFRATANSEFGGGFGSAGLTIDSNGTLTTDGEIQTAKIAFTDGDDAIAIENGGTIKLSTGLRNTPAVKVTTAINSNVNEWVKFAELSEASTARNDSASAVFLIRFTDAERMNTQSYINVSILLEVAVGANDPSNPTVLNAEVFDANSGDDVAAFDPTTMIELWQKKDDTNPTGALYIKNPSQFNQVYVSMLNGNRNHGGAAEMEWLILTGQSWMTNAAYTSARSSFDGVSNQDIVACRLTEKKYSKVTTSQLTGSAGLAVEMNSRKMTMFDDGVDMVISASAGLKLVANDGSGDIKLHGNVAFDNILVEEYLGHQGDTDTKLHFPDAGDQMKLSAGGVEFVHITEDGSQDKIVFNPNNQDIDFVVVGGDAAKKFIDFDAQNNNLKLGADTSGNATLSVSDSVTVNPANQTAGFRVNDAAGNGLFSVTPFTHKVQVIGDDGDTDTIFEVKAGSTTIVDVTNHTTNGISLGTASIPVKIVGDLVVGGATTTINTTNLLVEDPVVVLNKANSSANGQGGIAIEKGGTSLDMVFGRVANDTWGVGTKDTNDGAVTTLADMTLANIRAARFECGDSATYISGDGTDITLTATGDINVPANVGVTFGNDAEKIEGDGTDLRFFGNNLILSASADVLLPGNVGLAWGPNSTEKIEGNGSKLTLSTEGDIDLSPGGAIRVTGDNQIEFGNADSGEYIKRRISNSGGLLIQSDASNGAIELNNGQGGGPILIGGNSADLKIIFGSGQDTGLGGQHGQWVGAAGAAKLGDLVAAAEIDLILSASQAVVLNYTGHSGTKLYPRLEFGSKDSTEYIRGDGTDLSFFSGAKLKLSPATSIEIQNDKPLNFDASGNFKIQKGSSSLDITGATINLNATSQVNVPEGVDLVFDAAGTDPDNVVKINGDSSNNLNLSATSGEVKSDTHLNVAASKNLRFTDNNARVYRDGDNMMFRDAQQTTAVTLTTLNTRDVVDHGFRIALGPDRLKASGSFSIDKQDRYANQLGSDVWFYVDSNDSSRNKSVFAKQLVMSSSLKLIDTSDAASISTLEHNLDVLKVGVDSSAIAQFESIGMRLMNGKGLYFNSTTQSITKATNDFKFSTGNGAATGLIIGDDNDGYDRSIIFGHTTLKTIAGIDDSLDAFIINTDAAFDNTLSNNSLTIDANHNVGVGGDLTVHGGDIAYSNGQNATLDVAATAADNAGKSLSLSAGDVTGGSGTGNTAGGDLVLSSGASTGTGTSTMQFKTATAGSEGNVSSTPVERMRIHTNGKVGIGDTTPNAQLDVAHTGIGIAAQSNANSVASSLSLTNSHAGSSAGVQLSATLNNGVHGAFAGQINFGKVQEWDNADNATHDGYMSFSVLVDKSVSETMRIANGKVGIGITAPSYKLDVDGDIRVRGNDIRDNSGNPAITFDGSANTTTNGTLTLKGHALPHANNTYDLGSTTYRFRNIYTNDLNLCNEGMGNDVDGTSGNWTIQEGEDNLYVINNITGKKFKMMLQPVEDGE